MSNNINLHRAELTDIEEIREIYSYYVLNTCACLDETVPDKPAFIELYENLKQFHLPFYVAKIDGKIVGYCYANQYRKRSAYRFTVETSIYIDKDFTGQGIAKKLFKKVLNEVKSAGYKQMIAVVVDQGRGYSDKFHIEMGFKEKGRLSKVGYKFGKWLDIFLFQKEI